MCNMQLMQCDRHQQKKQDFPDAIFIIIISITRLYKSTSAQE